MRYEIENDSGETRREFNDRMGETTSEFKIPPHGMHIWQWFGKLNTSVSRVQDGFYHMIPPSEYVAWASLTGNIVYPTEYDILFAMDDVYCEQMNLELRSKREKEQERLKREAEIARQKKR